MNFTIFLSKFTSLPSAFAVFPLILTADTASSSLSPNPADIRLSELQQNHSDDRAAMGGYHAERITPVYSCPDGREVPLGQNLLIPAGTHRRRRRQRLHVFRQVPEQTSPIMSRPFT